MAILGMGGVVDSTGCGMDNPGSTVGLNNSAINKKALELGQGTTIKIVKIKLGEPTSVVTEGGETTLHYGPWKLLFAGGGLQRKTKERYLGARVGHKYNATELDPRILNMHRGMSIAAVEASLGMPDIDQEEFDGARVTGESLWYGSWELSFEKGLLVTRTKW
jgi:hypothetical protein